MSIRPTTILLRITLFSAISFVALLAIKLGLNAPPAHAQSVEAYAWRNVIINGGGFVPGIVFNTSEPNLVYARTDIGGAYRWNPATNSWIPLLDWIGFDDWNLTGVDSIATDPRDPNRVYIAAGTYTNEWTSHEWRHPPLYRPWEHLAAHKSAIQSGGEYAGPLYGRTPGDRSQPK